jgi:hypothetical protein
MPPAEREPTYPQIRNPFQSPQLPEAAANPNAAMDGGELDPLVCPECGDPVNEPGFCFRCRYPFERLIRLLNPKRWLFIDAGARAEREPWLYRPFSVSLFMGPITGSPLINNHTQQLTGFIAGVRVGYDFDEDWGMEMRLASANFPLESGYSSATQHNSDHFLWDIDFLYYPWGDAAVRPYFLMGIGTSRIKFVDQASIPYARILAGMPFGVGLKWRASDWFIFRMECLDNVAFAGGSIIQMQHNISFTAGFEIRFGRPRVQYWPWDPGR